MAIREAGQFVRHHQAETADQNRECSKYQSPTHLLIPPPQFRSSGEAGFHAQLVQDGGHVVIHRAPVGNQNHCDLAAALGSPIRLSRKARFLAGLALGDPVEDFGLPFGQPEGHEVVAEFEIQTQHSPYPLVVNSPVAPAKNQSPAARTPPSSNDSTPTPANIIPRRQGPGL